MKKKIRIMQLLGPKRVGQLILGLLLILFVVLVGVLYSWNNSDVSVTKPKGEAVDSSQQTDASTKTARVMAHGDLLFHDLLYMSALQADGSYDFTENFEYVIPWFEQADLVIGDFEGTISSDYPLAGYPLFNAPAEVATAIQAAGYDVVDLAHNHILDSHLSGLISTATTFKELGIDVVGVYPEGNRQKAPLLIKEVNGIKIAILAYSYGFNGMEAGLTAKEQAAYLSDLGEEQMEAEIRAAEKVADATIVLPQMGVEYALEPTEEQISLYQKMVDWGADIVFGGHPHVIEPTEIINKDGEDKLIIYSMGNFLSNQRYETLENYWTERGVLMDVTLEKVGDKTTIKTAQAHPTWVSRTPKGTYSPEGYALYLYQIYVLEDFIPGGNYRKRLDEATKSRIDVAYQEVTDLVNLTWPEAE